jgi:hypothetical protein
MSSRSLTSCALQGNVSTISPELLTIMPLLTLHIRVLVSTIYFIETHVMEKDLEGPDPRFNDDTPPEIDVYLFVWDRFRMIAKDFILQLDSSDGNSQMGGSILGLTFLLRCGQTDSSAETVSERVYIDRLCVECHERMCRWHIMMEHHMSHNGRSRILFLHPLKNDQHSYF